MARRGRFGRIPRAAPDLTGTIVALLREYQAQQESNLVDAWKNGGTFEGKKATDEMLLDYYKERESELGAGDPLKEEAKNTVQQYEYAIANSKQELQYARGNASDGDMARFYRSWAGKLPRQSEAWRSLMSNAAAYADRARTAASAARGAATARSYQNAYDKAWGKNEAAYDAVQNMMHFVAIESNALVPGERLGELRPGQRDMETFQLGWERWAASEDGKNWMAKITQEVRRAGGNGFNGDFSWTNLVSMAENKARGLKQRIKIATKAGDKEEVNRLQKEQRIVANEVVVIGSYDEMGEYEVARDIWEEARNNPLSDPVDLEQANQEYKKTLQGLKDRIPSDPGNAKFVGNYLRGGLQGEIDALDGISSPNTTWFEDAIGFTPTTGELAAGEGGGEKEKGALSDAEGTAAEVRLVRDNLANLMKTDANGDPLYVLTRTNKGKIGNEGPLTAVPISSLQGMAVAYDPSATRTIIGPDGVPQRINATRAIIGEPVVASTRPTGEVGAERPGVDAAMQASELTGNPNIGEVYRGDGENAPPIYGFWGDNGRHYFSHVNPFISAPGPGEKGGLTVTIPTDTAMTPTSGALAPTFRSPQNMLGFRPSAGGPEGRLVGPGPDQPFSSSVYRSHFMAKNAVTPTGRAFVSDPKNAGAIEHALRAESNGDPAVFREKAREWWSLRAATHESLDRKNRMKKMDDEGLGRLPVDDAWRDRPAGVGIVEHMRGPVDADAAFASTRAKLTKDIEKIRGAPVGGRIGVATTPEQRRKNTALMLQTTIRNMHTDRMEDTLQAVDEMERRKSLPAHLRGGGPPQQTPLFPAKPAGPALGPPKPPAVKPPKPIDIKPPKPATPQKLRQRQIALSPSTGYGSTLTDRIR